MAAKPIVASRRSKLPSHSEDSPANISSPMSRKDSDSSSRGRMGSPSGKSHDSSDSEQSWSRLPSGETRLDRLVRRPSSETKEKPKPKAKPRLLSNNAEHLYDTVALDEDDSVYDNHLLYEEKKSDTIGSGGSISADLGFDEPPLPARRNTGTLSSSDTTSSSKRLMEDDLEGEMMEEEETYVNLQFFMQKRRNTGDSSAGMYGVLLILSVENPIRRELSDFL